MGGSGGRRRRPATVAKAEVCRRRIDDLHAQSFAVENDAIEWKEEKHTTLTKHIQFVVEKIANNFCILYVALFGQNIFIKQINVQQWF